MKFKSKKLQIITMSAFLILLIYGSTLANVTSKSQISETLTKKVAVAYLSDDSSSKEFERVFFEDNIVEQSVRSVRIKELSDLQKLKASIIVLVGHGEKNGFRINTRLYDWDSLNFDTSSIIILAMCYSGEASCHAVKFPGIIDAKIAAEFSKLVIYSSLGYKDAADERACILLETDELIDLLVDPQNPLGIGEYYSDINFDIMLNYKFIMGLVPLTIGGIYLCLKTSFSPIDFLYAFICYFLDELLEAFLSFIPSYLAIIKDIIKVVVKATIGGVLYYYLGPAQTVFSSLKGMIASYIGNLLVLDIAAPWIFNMIKWGIEAVNGIFQNPVLDGIAGIISAYATYSGYKDIKSGFKGAFDDLGKRCTQFLEKIGGNQIPVGPLMGYTLAAVSGDLASAICSFFKAIGVSDLSTIGMHLYATLRVHFLIAVPTRVSVPEAGISFDTITFPNWTSIFESSSSGSGGSSGGSSGGGGGGKPGVMCR